MAICDSIWAFSAPREGRIVTTRQTLGRDVKDAFGACTAYGGHLGHGKCAGYRGFRWHPRHHGRHGGGSGHGGGGERRRGGEQRVVPAPAGGRGFAKPVAQKNIHH